MKKIGFICAIVGLLVACRPQNNQWLVVSGKILHAQQSKLYLKQLPFGAPNPIVVDSCSLSKDSSFQLKTIASQEGIYQLALGENDPAILLINDVPNITVKLDVDNYKAYEVIGSPASVGLHNFLHAYNKVYPKLVAIIQHNDSLKNTIISDSLATVIQVKLNSQTDQLHDLINENLSKTNSSAFSYYVLAKAMEVLEADEVYRLANESAIKFKNNTSIDYLRAIAAKSLPHYDLLNKPAPFLSSKDTSGKLFGLDSLKEKYVLVNFWASANKASREANIDLKGVYNKYKNNNFTILSVSLDDRKRVWVNAIEEDKLRWYHINDLRGDSSLVLQNYHVPNKVIPYNVLVSPAGNIVAFNVKSTKLDGLLAKLLNKP